MELNNDETNNTTRPTLTAILKVNIYMNKKKSLKL